MATVESAWLKRPDYDIELIPWRGTAKVWLGDVLLADTAAAIRLTEQDHVDRLYVPEADVRWEHFAASDHHTVCPFKGEADYWHLTVGDTTIENAVWAYRTPFPEVGGIAGHVCFYHDKVEVVLEDRWPGDPDGEVVRTRFPAWGTVADLLGLLDVSPAGPGVFTSPAYPTGRNVVEGGHQLAQSVIAAAKTVPGQRVINAHMIFAKAAPFDRPLSVEVDVLRAGRSFSTVQARVMQDGQLRSAGLVLMDASPADTIRHDAPLPDVPGPEDAEPLDMSVIGRDLRVVNGDYKPDPDRIGPPELYVWCRFRDRPAEPYQHAALMAQSTTHWTIAAGMLPHAGFGEAQAHVTLSTGVMTATVAFLDEVDVTEWLLYSTKAVYAGRGLVQGEGRIQTRDGRVVGTYAIQTMVREFARDPGALGLDATNAM